MTCERSPRSLSFYMYANVNKEEHFSNVKFRMIHQFFPPFTIRQTACIIRKYLTICIQCTRSICILKKKHIIKCKSLACGMTEGFQISPGRYYPFCQRYFTQRLIYKTTVINIFQASPHPPVFPTSNPALSMFTKIASVCWHRPRIFYQLFHLLPNNSAIHRRDVKSLGAAHPSPHPLHRGRGVYFLHRCCSCIRT